MSRTRCVAGLLLAIGSGCATPKPSSPPSDTGNSTTTPMDTGAIDADGDGFDATLDCNDNDAQVYLGAEEIPYDGIDNDCLSITPDGE